MDDLVDQLIANGTLHSPLIIEAFRATDRAHFIPPESRGVAYYDEPVHIGFQQTISQPSTVAFMLELLQAEHGNAVLDIGSGSGWTTALLAHIVGSEGSVLGLERIDELAQFGSDNLTALGYDHAHIEHIGLELGAPKRAPFDRILVSAAARDLPNELVSQLTEHGLLVLPIRNAIWKVQRVEHQPLIEKYEGYVFVPLIIG